MAQWAPEQAGFKSEVDARLGSAATRLDSLPGVPSLSHPVLQQGSSRGFLQGGASR